MCSMKGMNGLKQEEKLNIIAYIYTDFPEKFGIPRQSGLVKGTQGRIVFEPSYRSMDAVKGLDGFDYIWLLWRFEIEKREQWHATVKPPRLGGNETMGVFATRSPFRPNPIGLSSVRLEKIEETKDGPVLLVSGVDLRNKTSIYDIKPYLPYTDSHEDVRAGFTETIAAYELEVQFPQDLLERFQKEKRESVMDILRQDPRPSYHEDANRKYGVSYAGKDIHFTVCGNRLQVFDVVDITHDERDYKINIEKNK